jgi:hypothetical protein
VLNGALLARFITGVTQLNSNLDNKDGFDGASISTKNTTMLGLWHCVITL